MKPLLFCARSVRAWQMGAKTQTRRLVRPQPPDDGDWQLAHVNRLWGWWLSVGEEPGDYDCLGLKRQPYAVGDLLWIREGLIRGSNALMLYGADSVLVRRKGVIAIWQWKRPKLPAMFMPRWACRYYARVVSVRPERLRDISMEDCIAEGMPSYTRAKGVLSLTPPDHRWWYIEWWDQLHRKPEDQWEANPWVWVYVLEEASASGE